MGDAPNLVSWLLESSALYAVARRWGIDTSLPFSEVRRLVDRLPQPKGLRR